MPVMRALELGTQQHRGQESVLIEQHVLVERHVGDANGALIAQRAVVAPDGNFEDRTVAMRVQAAVAVVIAHRVGGRKIRDPARLRAAGSATPDAGRDTVTGPGDRQRQRAALPDGVVENRVNAAQERSAERGKAVREQLAERLAFVDALTLTATGDCASRSALTSILLELPPETFESLFQFVDFALQRRDPLLETWRRRARPRGSAASCAGSGHASQR